MLIAFGVDSVSSNRRAEASFVLGNTIFGILADEGSVNERLKSHTGNDFSVEGDTSLSNLLWITDVECCDRVECFMLCAFFQSFFDFKTTERNGAADSVFSLNHIRAETA